MKTKPEIETGHGIVKCVTGIRGLDEITEGGLPRDRATLICGPAGCGKTLLALEFILRGARDFNEPGVFMTFQETAKELAENISSLAFDLPDLIRRKQVLVDHVIFESAGGLETGKFDLGGLFIRLGQAVDAIGARRVAIDGLESLFVGLSDKNILRNELLRLFRWFKDKNLTVVVTAEQGENLLTRHSLEEYISDCVIAMDNRVINQVATRRVRIVKYRGSRHGTNEYPALIDEQGLSVLPISSLGLNYPVSTEHVSSGIAPLDVMLNNQGYFKGSSILVSGTAGTGKSSIAASFADSICQRGGRTLYWSMEESSAQILRNMSSIGLDLIRHVNSKQLLIYTIRPTYSGLEGHLVTLHKMVAEFRPDAIIIDPISNLSAISTEFGIKGMLTRMIDFLKNQGITALFTSLTSHDMLQSQTEFGISSLMDTWLQMEGVQSVAERKCLFSLVKSRGMPHSNQVRRLLLTNQGIQLADINADQIF